MNEKRNLVIFNDSAQRTIIGEGQKSESRDLTLRVKNPVVVNIVPVSVDPVNGQPSGQLALQLLPVFFKEFLSNKESDVVYSYRFSDITMIEFDGDFDERLYSQYENTLNPMPTAPAVTPAPAAASNEAGNSTAPVIDLFNDKNGETK